MADGGDPQERRLGPWVWFGVPVGLLSVIVGLALIVVYGHPIHSCSGPPSPSGNHTPILVCSTTYSPWLTLGVGLLAAGIALWLWVYGWTNREMYPR